MFTILYWASPNVKHGRFPWISAGGLFAVAIWVVASGLFALYVSGFSSYNKTYGALAGIIIFLVWLWISNVAILLGAELNAEIAREHHIEAGHPADDEPFVEPRRAPATPAGASSGLSSRPAIRRRGASRSGTSGRRTGRTRGSVSPRAASVLWSSGRTPSNISTTAPGIAGNSASRITGSCVPERERGAGTRGACTQAR